MVLQFTDGETTTITLIWAQPRLAMDNFYNTALLKQCWLLCFAFVGKVG